MALIQKRTKIKVITVEMILVEHLTKDYGSGRGVFDVSFAVQKGEVFGFLIQMVQENNNYTSYNGLFKAAYRKNKRIRN